MDRYSQYKEDGASDHFVDGALQFEHALVWLACRIKIICILEPSRDMRSG